MQINQYKTLFLDRDGVINVHRVNDYVKCCDEFEFCQGVLEAMAILCQKFEQIIVITNQRGVGRGIMSEKDLEQIHTLMVDKIKQAKGRVDAIYYCKAVDDTDFYRKPNIGMALNAQKDFPTIDFTKTIMVGDSCSDMQFGMNINAKCVRIGKDYKSLYDFAQAIQKNE